MPGGKRHFIPNVNMPDLDGINWLAGQIRKKNFYKDLMEKILIKRIYLEPSESDGYRILVDRI